MHHSDTTSRRVFFSLFLFLFFECLRSRRSVSWSVYDDYDTFCHLKKVTCVSNYHLKKVILIVKTLFMHHSDTPLRTHTHAHTHTHARTHALYPKYEHDTPLLCATHFRQLFCSFVFHPSRLYFIRVYSLRSGDLSQTQRLAALEEFRTGEASVGSPVHVDSP
jgi:hypothetical protein